MNLRNQFLMIAACVLTAGAAACGTDLASGAASAPVTLTLQRAGGAAGATLAGLTLAPAHDTTHAGRPVRIAPELVDSLIVTVTEVNLIPARRAGRERSEGAGDASVGRHGPHRRPDGPGAGSRRDSLPPDRADSTRRRHRWVTLAVVGDGRIDLMNLPTEEGGGLIVASGDAPPGDYHRVRLVIASGQIWFNTVIVTSAGDTLQADVAYDVVFPSGGIMAEVELTIPESGGDVPLAFQTEETMARMAVTGDGRIIVAPVMRHRPGSRP
jgi:hypothetical protein